MGSKKKHSVLFDRLVFKYTFDRFEDIIFRHFSKVDHFAYFRHVVFTFNGEERIYSITQTLFILG